MIGGPIARQTSLFNIHARKQPPDLGISTPYALDAKNVKNSCSIFIHIQDIWTYPSTPHLFACADCRAIKHTGCAIRNKRTGIKCAAHIHFYLTILKHLPSKKKINFFKKKCIYVCVVSISSSFNQGLCRVTASCTILTFIEGGMIDLDVWCTQLRRELTVCQRWDAFWGSEYSVVFDKDFASATIIITTTC